MVKARIIVDILLLKKERYSSNYYNEIRNDKKAFS